MGRVIYDPVFCKMSKIYATLLIWFGMPWHATALHNAVIRFATLFLDKYFVFACCERCREFFRFACEIVDEAVASFWSICFVNYVCSVFAKVHHHDYRLLVNATREDVKVVGFCSITYHFAAFNTCFECRLSVFECIEFLIESEELVAWLKFRCSVLFEELECTVHTCFLTCV